MLLTVLLRSAQCALFSLHTWIPHWRLEITPTFSCLFYDIANDQGGRWVELEGGFEMLWACLATHMSYDQHIAPDAEFGDGLYHVLSMPDSFTCLC
jgi:hypothetical protein